MAYNSVFFQVLLLAILLAYVVFLFRSRLRPKMIRRSAEVILILGIILNMYGLHLQGYAEGPLTVFGRSLVYAVKMFFYSAELIELEEAQHAPYFLDLYYLTFYAAALTSLSAIIMLFGKRVMTLLSLALRRDKFKHVFIGVNNRSLVIARAANEADTAFIEFPTDKDNEKLSLKGIIKGMGGNNGDELYTKRHGLVVLRARRRLGDIEPEGNVFASIGLERLKALTDENTAFYILSEDSDRNLSEMMTLLRDPDMMKSTIHVCISKEGVARYYKTILKQTGVHFIYPSSMAVVELMKRPECHPAALMKAVQGGFNALVIGFGETGQAVCKFLYEFSAAVTEDGRPMPVSITINDERLDSLMGPFTFDNQSMCNSGLLHFENLGTESSEFWRRLDGSLDDLNYIAISMSEEASNLDLACTIMMYAMKKRHRGLDGLKIVIRKKVTLPHERKLVEKMNEKAGHEVMVCYGEYEKIFTPEMIISKKGSGINKNATSIADRIEEAYGKVSGKEIDFYSKHESFHKKSTARMELHQMISRANQVQDLAQFVNPAAVTEEELENLSRREHLRYSRYLTAHGYSYGEEDDDVFKTNHQICDWESLTDDDRRYHRDMVLAMISLL